MVVRPWETAVTRGLASNRSYAYFRVGGVRDNYPFEMAKRKGDSYLGGHTVVHTTPDFDAMRKLEEKRANQSKYANNKARRRKTKKVRADPRFPEALNRWSKWLPLDGRPGPPIPTQPGLYRIQLDSSNSLIYIGQTGRSLRERLGALHGIFGDVMPYSDPHTAAPGMWALLQDGKGPFRVSTIVVEGDKAKRLSYECLAISMHRAEFGMSPTLNFGRMPPGWTKSSPNNRSLAEQGRRSRGGRDYTSLSAPSLPVLGRLAGSPMSRDWIGLQWSQWRPISSTDASPDKGGVYRIGRSQENHLTYIGQGRIRSRLLAHQRKATSKTGGGRGFAQEGMMASWVALERLERAQLLEIENDLIASHLLTQGRSPSAQFLG